MIRTLSLLACAFCPLIAEDWSPVPGMSAHPRGELVVRGLTLTPLHYDDAWRMTSPEMAVSDRGSAADGVWRLTGPWKIATGAATLTEEIRRDGEGIAVSVHLDTAAATNLFCLSLTLDGPAYRGRSLRFDDAVVELPRESPKVQVHYAAGVAKVRVPLADGGSLELSGTLTVQVQDNRTWNSDTFSLRLIADAEHRVAAGIRCSP